MIGAGLFTARRLAIVPVVLVMAASAACSVRPPAPSSPPLGTPNPTSSAAPLASDPAISSPIPSPPPAGPGLTAHLLCDEPQPCEVSLLDAEGSTLPGWPVQLEGLCSGATTDPTGRLYVACEGVEGAVILGFDVAGVPVAGWPVTLPNSLASITSNDFSSICGPMVSPLAVAADGQVFVATDDGVRKLLRAFNPDGTERVGWPQPLPGNNEFRCAGFALAPNGTVRAWGYEGPPAVEIELGYGPFAQRTVFTALGPDGVTLPGWPFGSTGTASGPLIGADGTLYHESELGNIWAHDVAGQPKAGWPYRIQTAGMPLYLSPDGRIVVIPTYGSDGILALGPDGAVAPGWPQPIGGSRESPCLVLGDTDCFAIVEPAFGPDGTLYLSLMARDEGVGGTIVAFDRGGNSVAGWPVQLADRTAAVALTADAAGNLVVRTAQCGGDPCWSTVEYATILFSPDGQPAG